MPTLPKYKHFAGRHWETGTIHNYLACLGVRAPHTGRPYSEALLLGVSGGVLMGYFSFAYAGHDPHVAILTRNTFDPLETLLVRLGVVQHLRQTPDAQKAERHLVAALEEGLPAVIWADAFSLPYNNLPARDDWWGMFPILVYGFEPEAVAIADRAAVPLAVTPAELAAARGRVKKDKHRLLTLEPPNPDKLPLAVQQGLWDCLKRYTEAPVKSARSSFGLAAFQRWADALTRPKDKQSWERVFPAGAKMYAGLVSAFDRFSLGTLNAGRDRELYADFLEEAGAILGRPALRAAAGPFRASARGWDELGLRLLPDSVALLRETRELLVRRGRLFVEQGGGAAPEIAAINRRLDALRDAMEREFPLTAGEVTAMRQAIAAGVRQVGALEQAAYDELQAAMAGEKQPAGAAA
jgi:hypothetical protein